MLGEIEPFQQSTEYTCSAAVSHAVFKHWGYDIDEVTLAYLLKVDPINGASAARVAALARDLGFQAVSRNFGTINQLKRITDQGVPVILRVLSWKHPGQYHFVIVTSIDDFGVSVMDPNVEGNRRRLTHEELWERWSPDRIGVVIMPQHFQLDGVTQPPSGWFWVTALGVTLTTVGLAWTVTQRRCSRT
jgi:ABC-type bacteriocin/lantibiotic exporter with double-glycine peptidase domain